MFDTEDKSTSSHVEKASQYKGVPVLCLIIASSSVSVNTGKFPFKIAVAIYLMRDTLSFSISLNNDSFIYILTIAQ